MTVSTIWAPLGLTALLGLASCSAPAAQDNLAVMLNQHLTEAAAENGFQGSLAVVLAGDVIVARSFGMASHEHQVPNTSQTRYRIGSVTKHIAATAILMLQDQRRLRVSDLVADYIPGLPSAWAEIRIHHLLNHTAGLPDLTDIPDWKEKVSSPSSLREEAEWHWQAPLLYPPGQRFRYSNTGYDLAGLIIEQVSGFAYEEFLRLEVFDRLGLSETGFDRRDHII